MYASDNLHRFDLIASDDEVKTDLELTCVDCGEVVCDVEADDNLKTLCQVADDHECDEARVTCEGCGESHDHCTCEEAPHV